MAMENLPFEDVFPFSGVHFFGEGSIAEVQCKDSCDSCWGKQGLILNPKLQKIHPGFCKPPGGDTFWRTHCLEDLSIHISGWLAGWSRFACKG